MTDQLSFLDAKGRARRANPATAHAAAAGPRLRGQRLQCLFALDAAGERGVTPDEAWPRTFCAYPHVVATRFAELADAGLAARTETTRPTATGHQSHVWLVTDAGRKTAARTEGK